jgi:hypothetical protein
VGNSCDLAELRVVTGGTSDGLAVYENTTLLVTFPDGMTLNTDDLIVLHWNGDDMNCNGGGTTTPANESTAPDEILTATLSPNYDSAYDFWFDDNGIGHLQGNTLTLRTASAVIRDAALVGQGGSMATGALSVAGLVATAAQWMGITDPVDETAFNAAAFDWTGINLSTSAQRDDNDDTNSAADWALGATSFGALNAGQ